MNNLYMQIKKDMVAAMKDGNKNRQSLLKVLVSDINRDPKKDYSDEKVIAVIQKTIKSLEENYRLLNNKKSLDEMKYLEAYLPKKISNDEIVDFLNSLDFSKFKNKMQAVGLVMKHFPNGSVSGKQVKEIVENYKK